MASSLTRVPSPLTLSEQLDAMLSGWLDRHDPSGERRLRDGRAKAVVTVADAAVPELEAFCVSRGLAVERASRDAGRWAVLVVEGGELPVRGFTEITRMYNR